MKVEVKEAQSNEVDWTKNPQLVISEAGAIVLVTDDQSDTSSCNFRGVNINTGFYSKYWTKKIFKPFHGEITLKND